MAFGIFELTNENFKFPTNIFIFINIIDSHFIDDFSF